MTAKSLLYDTFPETFDRDEESTRGKFSTKPLKGSRIHLSGRGEVAIPKSFLMDEH